MMDGRCAGEAGSREGEEGNANRHTDRQRSTRNTEGGNTRDTGESAGVQPQLLQVQWSRYEFII